MRALHNQVTLSIDIFFVKKIPFLLKLSRVLCFGTATHLGDRKIETIYKALESIVKYYFQKGFKITGVTADGEFAALEEHFINLPGAPKLNVTSAGEHEPFIKRKIRVVKEHVRSVRNSLTFEKIPQKMKIHMVFNPVKLLNLFPVKGGLKYSPKLILAG